MEYNEEPKRHSDEELGNEPEIDDSERFSFLQEKIKDKPINKRRVMGKLLGIAVCGIILGVFTSVGFAMARPWAERVFHRGPDPVTIQPEEDEYNEYDEPEPPPEEEVPQVVDLDIYSYRQLNRALNSVANEASRSVVEVMGIQGDENWIRENFGQASSVAGVIFADNGQDLLILTSSRILRDAENLYITFADGQSYEGALHRRDENLGIAIIRVPKESISEATWNQIDVIETGNSNAVAQGDTIIALGNPFGYYSGRIFGTVSSTRNSVTIADGEYALLATDITGNSQGTGILVSISGQLVGLIHQEVLEGESRNQINGLAISRLTGRLTLLLNGDSVPYIGIEGVDVTEDISREQNMPRGVYVKGIEPGSPAMDAGIRNGDIITEVNGVEITSLSTYSSTLKDIPVGTQITVIVQRGGAEGYVEVSISLVVGRRE